GDDLDFHFVSASPNLFSRHLHLVATRHLRINRAIYVFDFYNLFGRQLAAPVELASGLGQAARSQQHSESKNEYRSATISRRHIVKPPYVSDIPRLRI